MEKWDIAARCDECRAVALAAANAKIPRFLVQIWKFLIQPSKHNFARTLWDQKIRGKLEKESTMLTIGSKKGMDGLGIEPKTSRNQFD